MRLPTGTKEIRGTNSRNMSYPHSDITERVIGCAIAVHRELHPGFMEGVYENALCHEMAKQGLRFDRQKAFPVCYDGVRVGQHRADLFIENSVIVELKAISELTDRDTSQLLSTMKAAGAKVGLLMNFHESRLVDGVRRLVL